MTNCKGIDAYENDFNHDCVNGFDNELNVEGNNGDNMSEDNDSYKEKKQE